MNLQEKVLYLRKKSGLSQEALAEKLGVSRQAISKWETGDATPELSKLVLLAKEFNVTTDWLLSEDEVYEETKKQTKTADTGFGFIKRLVKKYGWLAGIYIAVSGVPFALFGWFFRYSVGKIFDSIAQAAGAPTLFGSNLYLGIMLFGIIVFVTGIAMAVFLKNKSRKK